MASTYVSAATSSTIRIKDNELFISDSEKLLVGTVINNKLKFSNIKKAN